MEASGLCATQAELAYVGPSSIILNDTIIVMVGNVQSAFGVHQRSHWSVKVVICGSPRTPSALPFSIGGKALNTTVSCIDDIQTASAVHTNPNRRNEVTGLLPPLPERHQVLWRLVALLKHQYVH